MTLKYLSAYLCAYVCYVPINTFDPMLTLFEKMTFSDFKKKLKLLIAIIIRKSSLCKQKLASTRLN